MKKFRSKSQDRARNNQKTEQGAGFVRSLSRDRHVQHYHNTPNNHPPDLNNAPTSPSLAQSRSSRHWVRKSIKQKNIANETSEPQTELSTTEGAPGVIKIFGSSVVPGAEYKSVLSCTKSTAKGLVKEALERYGISRDESSKYVLCEVLGQFVYTDQTAEENSNERVVWQEECRRIVSDNEQPLMMQSYWKPGKGLVRRFELYPVDLAAGVSKEDTGTWAYNANARRMLIAKSRNASTGQINTRPQLYTSSHLSTRSLGNDDSNDDGRMFWQTPLRTHNSNIYSGDCYRDSNVNLNYVMAESHQSPAVPAQNHVTNRYFDDRQNRGIDVVSDYPRLAHTSVHASPPADRPYLLSMSGYNRSLDCLFHTIDEEMTVVSGPNGQQSNSRGCICLHAPDILPEHCWFYFEPRTPHTSRRGSYSDAMIIHPHPLSRIRLNNCPINAKTSLKPDDVIAIGNYYVFMLKMPTLCGTPPPSVKLGMPPHVFSDTVRLHDMFSKWQYEKRKQFEKETTRYKLPYTHDQEEELLQFIMSLKLGDNVECPQMACYLLIMALECSSLTFVNGCSVELLQKIHGQVQQHVLAHSKRIAGKQLDFHYDQTQDTIEDVLSDLQPVFFWMNNLVEFVGFLNDDQRNMFIDPSICRQRRKHNGNPIHEKAPVLIRFDELIRSLFKQSVYYISKILYAVLPDVLECKSFEDEYGSPADGYQVQPVIHIFQMTYDCLRHHNTHPRMTLQLFAYLAFFANTSLFNCLMTKAGSTQYYSWVRGVQLRRAVDVMEEWADRHGLLNVFKSHFTKINALADLLSTTKTQLIQGSWTLLANDFPALSRAQLRHVLCHLNQDSHRQEQYSRDHDESDVMESFSNHPPLGLPVDGWIVNLQPAVSQPSFQYALAKTKSRFYKTNKGPSSKMRSPPPYRRPPVPGRSSSPNQPSDSHQQAVLPRVQQQRGTKMTNSNLEEYLKHRYEKIKDCREWIRSDSRLQSNASLESKCNRSISVENTGEFSREKNNGEIDQKAFKVFIRDARIDNMTPDGVPVLEVNDGENSVSIPENYSCFVPVSDGNLTKFNNNNASSSLQKASIVPKYDGQSSTMHMTTVGIYDEYKEQTYAKKDLEHADITDVSRIKAATLSFLKSENDSKTKNTRTFGTLLFREPRYKSNKPSARAESHPIELCDVDDRMTDTSVDAGSVEKEVVFGVEDEYQRETEISPVFLTPDVNGHKDAIITHPNYDVNPMRDRETYETTEVHFKDDNAKSGKEAGGCRSSNGKTDEIAAREWESRDRKEDDIRASECVSTDRKKDEIPACECVSSELPDREKDIILSGECETSDGKNYEIPARECVSPDRKKDEIITRPHETSDGKKDVIHVREYISPIKKHEIPARDCGKSETTDATPVSDCELSERKRDEIAAAESRSSPLSYYHEAPYVYVSHEKGKADASCSSLKVLPLTAEDNVQYHRCFDDSPCDDFGEIDNEQSFLEGNTIGSDSMTEDDVFVLELRRTETGIGLGLIDGLYTALGEAGLYVRTIVPGSPADGDRRLTIGDRILAVNEFSIVGIDYHSAMEAIRKAGDKMKLLVAKSDIATTMRITASSC